MTMTGSSIRKRQCASLPASFYVVNDYLKSERDDRDKHRVFQVGWVANPGNLMDVEVSRHAYQGPVTCEQDVGH